MILPTVFVPEPAPLWRGQLAARGFALFYSLLLLPLLADAVQAESPGKNPQFMEFTRFEDFARLTNGSSIELLSSNYLTTSPWTQLVLSWEAKTPHRSAIEFAVKPALTDDTNGFYSMGIWSTVDALRQSVPKQRSAHAEVQTDILVLQQPATGFQLRITLRPDTNSTVAPDVTYLGVSLLDTTREISPRPAHRVIWGKVLDVPQRSQLAYPGGRGWCSPTAVSMALQWWAAKQGEPKWAKDVPEVAAGVHDPQWPGTGNWSFNTAYAATLGLHARVVRLPDLAALEEWVAADVPVICSVAYPLLKGKSNPGDSGHLVVCVGFTLDGDVVANDPWAPPEAGEAVRKTFARDNFSRAWAHSHHTAYLIFPKSWPHPKL